MKKLFLLISVTMLLFSCGNFDNGELTGVPNREMWFAPQPYGMLFIKSGSYNMGPNDQDIFWGMTAESKTVSIFAFWMDETEITNNEYRQFVYWVRDSIARRLLAADDEDRWLIKEDDFGNDLNEVLGGEPYPLNWFERLNWGEFIENGDISSDPLNEMFLPVQERYYRRKEIDSRKLNFEYFWIDYNQAARKQDFGGETRRSYNYETGKYDGEVISFSQGKEGKIEPITDRSAYIMRDIINVYPDTLCWVGDFTYSYNEPMTTKYFWHPAYDHYPVVGVTWKQARAFNIWRTQLYNSFLSSTGDAFVQDWRLPTESEWEYASRGGLKEAMYPWGGYYATNYKGCYIANFKPLRGNYVSDGGFYPVIVANNDPNEWGLYDMGGNVSEWTSNAFDEAAYSYTDDLNPDYQYEALPDDDPTLKRKIIRGGSWKDIGYYMQCGTRTYEYQDSCKSYIGFRSIRTYLGHDANDAGTGSQVY